MFFVLGLAVGQCLSNFRFMTPPWVNGYLSISSVPSLVLWWRNACILPKDELPLFSGPYFFWVVSHGLAPGLPLHFWICHCCSNARSSTNWRSLTAAHLPVTTLADTRETQLSLLSSQCPQEMSLLEISHPCPAHGLALGQKHFYSFNREGRESRKNREQRENQRAGAQGNPTTVKGYWGDVVGGRAPPSLQGLFLFFFFPPTAFLTFFTSKPVGGTTPFIIPKAELLAKIQISKFISL